MTPFDPFRQLQSFRDDMNRWMNQNFPNWAQQTFSFGPRIDVSQTETDVVLEAEIPGLVKDDDLDIQVTSDQVVLSGEIRRSRTNEPDERTLSQTKEQKDNTEQENQPTPAEYYHTERYIGQFHRVIPLPSEVDETKAEAEYQNGVLHIRIPKIRSDKGKRININFH